MVCDFGANVFWLSGVSCDTRYLMLTVRLCVFECTTSHMMSCGEGFYFCLSTYEFAHGVHRKWEFMHNVLQPSCICVYGCMSHLYHDVCLWYQWMCVWLLPILDHLIISLSVYWCAIVGALSVSSSSIRGRCFLAQPPTVRGVCVLVIGTILWTISEGLRVGLG